MVDPSLIADALLDLAMTLDGIAEGHIGLREALQVTPSVEVMILDGENRPETVGRALFLEQHRLMVTFFAVIKPNADDDERSISRLISSYQNLFEAQSIDLTLGGLVENTKTGREWSMDVEIRNNRAYRTGSLIIMAGQL